jgi:hypothetical protein
MGISFNLRGLVVLHLELNTMYLQKKKSANFGKTSFITASIVFLDVED